MDQVEQNDIELCPLCLQPNLCQVDNGHNCWCMTMNIPQKVLDQLPDHLKGKSCICKNCILKEMVLSEISP